MARERRKEFEKRERTLVSVAPFVAFDLISPNGYFRLAGRQEGKRYETTIVRDAVSKAPLGDDKFTVVKLDVDDLADSLIRDHAADKFGCFVAEGAEPTEEELVQAEKTYDTWRRAQVAEADVLWATYHKHIFIGQHAKLACKELGLTREWMSSVAETKQCPNCAKPNILAQARCGCGAVLDWEKALEFGLLSEREELRAIAGGKLVTKSFPALVASVEKAVDDEEAEGTF
jgi:hypothetical protein